MTELRPGETELLKLWPYSHRSWIGAREGCSQAGDKMSHEDKELETLKAVQRPWRKAEKKAFLLLQADAVPWTKTSGWRGEGVGSWTKPSHLKTGGCRPEATQQRWNSSSRRGSCRAWCSRRHVGPCLGGDCCSVTQEGLAPFPRASPWLPSFFLPSPLSTSTFPMDPKGTFMACSPRSKKHG